MLSESTTTTVDGTASDTASTAWWWTRTSLASSGRPSSPTRRRITSQCARWTTEDEVHYFGFDERTTTAGKGSNVVRPLLKKFTDMQIIKLQAQGDSLKHLIIWCDRCVARRVSRLVTPCRLHHHTHTHARARARAGARTRTRTHARTHALTRSQHARPDVEHHHPARPHRHAHAGVAGLRRGTRAR